MSLIKKSNTSASNDCDKNQPKDVTTCADFETAISATKFGTFNIFLMLTAFPATLAAQFESTALSFVFPAAKCDLELSLENRGLLNAMFYSGMTTSGFLWGILIDSYGRKKMLLLALFLDIVFLLITTFSQSFLLLLISKFCGGFIINGASTALPTYLSEFHGMKYRSQVPLVIGLLYGLANICLPLLGWAVLPLNIDYSLFNDKFRFHAWNLYLLISAISLIISGTMFLLLPETPKYLMTTGRKEEALKVFQKIHKINTGLSDYPINNIKEENQLNIEKNGNINIMHRLWKQISPIFHKPYLCNLTLICTMSLLLNATINTLRLWLPEIFQAINDYEPKDRQNSLCDMLELIKPKNLTDNQPCSINLDNWSVYTNSIIVACASMLAYILTGTIINILGKKAILLALGVTAGLCAISLYFSTNAVMTLILLATNNALSCVCVDVMTSVVIDLFPTSLRGSALSLAFMSGRIGSVLGNLVFPFLLQSGCAPPFMTVGLIIICIVSAKFSLIIYWILTGFALLALLLPNTDLKPLE